MTMKPDILAEVLKRINAEFGFKAKGEWLQEGKCPACNKREFYTRADNPWIMRCGRLNRCGQEFAVKELYPDIFDTWSNRYRTSEKEPNAAADAYLINARGLRNTPLKGSYTQEVYKDFDRNITSATVRFPLPGGSHWERLIDQPGRFEKKAHFKKGGSYRGQWWANANNTIAVLARAQQIWLAEGIFDAESLDQGADLRAVSLMSCNNWPEQGLKALKVECAAHGLPLPELVFALDIGKAGTEYTRKFVDRAIEEGWDATAAQPRPEGESDKLDWNDLHMRDRLKPADIENYLWNGKILLAETATDKALLLWQKHGWSYFSFVHQSRTWWASINEAKIAEMMSTEGVSEVFAAERNCEVTEVANCAFRVLYFQQDKLANEAHYYLSIDLADSDKIYRYKFSSGALAASSEFKKALMGAAPGAQWTGSGRQLDRLFATQVKGLKTVETLDFTGYSREHGAWVLGGTAVKDGRVIELNAEDYFDLGKTQLKLKSPQHMLRSDYDADMFDTSWMDPLWTAWRGNGLVTLTFWFMSFFAEQIRHHQASLGYLEMWGVANTGKSTIILFLWKLCGLVTENYEGIDPSKSTMVGYIRTLARAANLPVVFVESDRAQEVPHAKKFDWSEIKGLFNGQIGRATGVKSGGNETYEPPFRGALIIEQNDAVVSGEPILSRIMPTQWTKTGWSQATKEAAEAIEQWPREKASGTMIHVIKREAAYMAAYLKAFAHFEQVMVAEKIKHARVRKCHAQLHAGLEALNAIIPIPADRLEESHRHINEMARTRDNSILSDPKVVADFWEAYELLTYRGHEANLSKSNNGTIAINIPAFEQLCRQNLVSCPPLDELRKHLKMSRSRPFVKADTVNGITGHLHCYIFKDNQAA